jgi:ABC-type lipoprotein export system ATPase subunit
LTRSGQRSRDRPRRSVPARLSGGEQQRVAIARALANDPRILLGDEPTGNLDHATGESVLGTLLDLVRHTGLAALIATHNLDLARRLDRIVALEDGRLRPLDWLGNRAKALLIDKLRFVCYFSQYHFRLKWC